MGVLAGVLTGNGFAKASCQANEALAKFEANPTHGIGIQPDRGAKPQMLQVGFRQVDGADVRGQALRDEASDVGEGLRKIVGTGNDLGDIR